MPQKILTEKDKEILSALLKNTEVKFSVIAKRFGIPISSVYRVYNKLRDMGILKGRLYIVNYSRIGLPLLAHFSITVSSDGLKVLEYLKTCENIEFCGESVDKSLIVSYGYFESKKDLMAFVKRLRKEFNIIKNISIIELEQETKIQKQPLKCKSPQKEYIFKIIPR